MRSLVETLLQEVKTSEASDKSAIYFPLDSGHYEVKPGLFALDTDLGNGEVDRKVFQIDRNFTQYRQIKLAARAERLSKYYQTHNYSNNIASAIARLIIERLVREYPQYFQLQSQAGDRFKFYNQLTQETLYLNVNWQLEQFQTQSRSILPPYISTLDALAGQIQEDLTVICRAVDGSNWVSAIHLCYPNHWSAEEKIGRDFATVHTPVAGIDKINRRSQAIVNTMIIRKPMVRFAWGLSTDTRLNHHPRSPSQISNDRWQGRHFQLQNPRLYLRIERQVIWGLPEYDAALFTIRTYFRDCEKLKNDRVCRSQLISAIESMTLESLFYKGLTETKASILQWLNEP
jgi:dimethylamine monooxygenase subunit A